MNRKEKGKLYMLWFSDAPLSESVKSAIKYYTKKYGNPPAEILIPETEKLEPMEGFNFVVRADLYVGINTLLLGVVDDETEEVCLEGQAE